MFTQCAHDCLGLFIIDYDYDSVYEKSALDLYAYVKISGIDLTHCLTHYRSLRIGREVGTVVFQFT